MSQRPMLSCECRHQLAEWVRLYCPSAAADGEFLGGLQVIVERELAAALRWFPPAGDTNPSAGRAGGPT